MDGFVRPCFTVTQKDVSLDYSLTEQMLNTFVILEHLYLTAECGCEKNFDKAKNVKITFQ